MKTLKIILAVLLIVILFITTPFHYLEWINGLDYYENFFHANQEITPEIRLDAQYLQKINLRFNLACICMPLFILSAAIVTFVNREKYYCGLISGGLLLIPIFVFVWYEMTVSDFAGYLGFPRSILSERWLMFNTGFGLVTTLFLLLPILCLLLVGSIETAVHFLKRKSGKTPAPEAAPREKPPVVQYVTNATSATELKQFKELLDLGAITQEEYDAKKKQLLDLPTADSAPAQRTGKCMMCGQADVPLETVEVVVAGMSRKRMLCAGCAAKFK